MHQETLFETDSPPIFGIKLANGTIVTGNNNIQVPTASSDANIIVSIWD